MRARYEDKVDIVDVPQMGLQIRVQPRQSAAAPQLLQPLRRCGAGVSDGFQSIRSCNRMGIKCDGAPEKQAALARTPNACVPG